MIYEEISKIIAKMLSAWKKAECYDEVANHSQRIFTLIQNNMTWQIEKSKKFLIWIKVKICREWLATSIRGRHPLNFQSLYRNFLTDLPLVRIVKWKTI